MSIYLFNFLTACLVMALGIGIDVAITTVLRSKQLTSTKVALFWVLGVSLTHTVFPMVGYLLTYFSIQVMPILTPVVGLVAFVLISHFLYQEFQDLRSETECQDERHIYMSFALILAVSWDALWSGPAKSAQVVNWPEIMVWGSFLVVGLLVTLASLLSWRLGQWLVKKSTASISPKVYLTALLVQYSVIAYFGLLALFRYTIQATFVWWHILIFSFCLVAIGLLFCNGRQADKYEAIP